MSRKDTGVHEIDGIKILFKMKWVAFVYWVNISENMPIYITSNKLGLNLMVHGGIDKINDSRLDCQ